MIKSLILSLLFPSLIYTCGIATNQTESLFPCFTKHHTPTWSVLSEYIHLLPLARYLDISNDELAQLLEQPPIQHLPHLAGYNTQLIAHTLDLIEAKTHLTWANDFREILLLLKKSKMNHFYYHGTNLSSLKYIEAHGFCGMERDYAVEDIEWLEKDGFHIGTGSAQKLDTFYISGRVEVSCDYGIHSPEWLDQTLSAHPEGANHPILRKYISQYLHPKQFALIAIQYKPRHPLSKKKIQTLTLQEAISYLPYMIYNTESNREIHTQDVCTSTLHYYLLPKELN
ncbi:MAG: hypothetical protein S4CHLAM102_12270 [Chlamydiia bacterium]|nr:hypothetical protein [Chlamydiia bacterium]